MKRVNGGEGCAHFPSSGRGLQLLLLHDKVLGPSESQPPPTFDPQACAWLWVPHVEFGSLPGRPAVALGRSEGGSANLAAAPRVWHT